MQTSTIINGQVQRKTLSTQLDRLDATLDGLADSLDQAVAQAVKETVAQVVREAVEQAVREVLGNPDLLRAALAQHAPSPVPVQAQPSTPEPERRSVKEMLKSGWNWLCEKATQTATQVKEKAVQGGGWCREKLRKGGVGLKRGYSYFRDGCQSLGKKLRTLSLTLWRVRQTCLIVLTVGLAGGVVGYFAGPVVSSVLGSLGGMALTLSGMALLPLWRLPPADASNASATSNS